jgi:DNA-directed RNA polymerase subunit RPC12/RpoP
MNDAPRADAMTCPQCGAPLRPTPAGGSVACDHCGSAIQLRVRDGVTIAELERRLSALERLRAPVRRRFRRRSTGEGGEVFASGTAFLLVLGFVVVMTAAGATVDGDAPLATAFAFGAVAAILVGGLVAVSRSDRRPRRMRRLEKRREQAGDG